jgi:hypothetical protein
VRPPEWVERLVSWVSWHLTRSYAAVAFVAKSLYRCFDSRAPPPTFTGTCGVGAPPLPRGKYDGGATPARPLRSSEPMEYLGED